MLIVGILGESESNGDLVVAKSLSLLEALVAEVFSLLSLVFDGWLTRVFTLASVVLLTLELGKLLKG